MNGPWTGGPRDRVEIGPSFERQVLRRGRRYVLPAAVLFVFLGWLLFGRQPGDAAMLGIGLLVLSVIGLGVLIFLAVGAAVVALSAIVIRLSERAMRGTPPGHAQTHETFMIEEWRHNRGESNPFVVVRDHGPTSL